jgi:hypothetical protein
MMKNIVELLGSKGEKHGLIVKILALISKVCGFFYYLLDNVVWVSSMGMIRYDKSLLI